VPDVDGGGLDDHFPASYPKSISYEICPYTLDLATRLSFILQMLKRLAFVLAGAGMLVSCGPTSSPQQPISDQLQVTAELTLDGQRLSQTWNLPAVQQTYTSGPGDLAVAMNPLWGPMTIGEKRTTSSSLQPASGNRRQVLLMKLPSGEGIGIDISGVSLKAGSTLEQTTNAARLYYFDSAEHPTRLIEQANANGMNTPCPEGLRVTSCSAQVTLKRIAPGAALALSSRAFVFASMDALALQIPDLRSIAELTPIIGGAAAPAITTLDPPTWQKVRSHAVGNAQRQPLAYGGGTLWSFPTQTATPTENRLQRITRYVTTLPPQYARCCGSFDRLDAGAQVKIAGQLEYKGRTFTYQAWQEGDQKPSTAIVDPAANVVVIIQPVRPKLIDLVSLR
jgi:hypothetical protein